MPLNIASDILNGPSKQTSYQFEIRDPRWFERSKAFLRSHPFCNSCRRSDIRLTVHHVNYDRAKRLWELVTLCKNCHELTHEATRSFRTTAAFCNASNIAKIVLLLDAQIRKHGDAIMVEKLSNL